jgi:hypothetical protein
MSAVEESSWRAYFEVEPWGTHAAEILGAQLCQIVWATNSTKAPPKMNDLMPFVEFRKSIIEKPKSAEQLQDKLRIAFAGIGKEIVNNGE